MLTVTVRLPVFSPLLAIPEVKGRGPSGKVGNHPCAHEAAPGFESTASMKHERDHDHQEATWMAAYAAGDDRVFSALFRALAPRLFGFFRRTIHDRAACEDMVQTTFTRLHAARASYVPGSPVRPWLFTIAAHVRIDELRRQKRRATPLGETDLDQVRADNDADSDFDMSPDAALDRGARQQSVRDAVDSLPPGYRMVLHLHRFEGLSFLEIGVVLGCSEGAARIRAFRAYAILRERLRPLVQEGE
jgi:RNA polymerase sigma-70 factor, ECF subfamily